MRPMLDVMTVEIACVWAAWEAAAAMISRVERALDRGRNGARLTTDVERLALFVLDHGHHAAITREPASCFCSDRLAVFEVAAARGAVS